MISADVRANFDIFRECLSGRLIERVIQQPKKPKSKRPQKSDRPAQDTLGVNGSRDEINGGLDTETKPEELAEFTEFIATEIFESFPPELQSISYSGVQNDPSIAETYDPPLSAATLENLTSLIIPSVTDSLQTYSFLPTNDTSSLTTLLAPPLNAYISSTTSPPPVYSSTRTSGCEICDRDWIPLTYHHLIPRSTHAKVIKRGWHEEWELNKVAWLCSACHGFVHRMAGNEELARQWWSVELLREREDVRRWAGWVRRVRWKAR